MIEMGLTKRDSMAIKGIAIVFMLFHHLYCEVSRFENFDVSFAPFSQEFIVNVGSLMKICVSIFAFITGYGLLKSIAKTPVDRASVCKWNLTRLLKTMSGYYFIYIIAFIVTQLVSGLPAKTYFSGSTATGIAYLLADFLGVSTIFYTPTLLTTWWYMSAAILFILFVPLIYSVAKKLGYLPVIAVIILMPRLLQSGYPGSTNPFSFILPLVFGMIFADYNLFDKISSIRPKNKAVAYITDLVFYSLAIVASYFVYTNFNTADIWEIKFAVIPVFFICFFRYCVVRIPVVRKVLVFFGKYSMTIFLTHNFIRFVYFNEFIYSFKNFMLIFVVLFILSLLLAIVLDSVKKFIQYDKLFDKFICFINKKKSV